MNFVDVAAGGVGAILIYCAIKDKSPIDVIKMGLQGQTAGKYTKDGTSSNSSTDVPPGKQFVDGTGNVPTPPHTSYGGVGPGTPATYEQPIIPAPTFVSV